MRNYKVDGKKLRDLREAKGWTQEDLEAKTILKSGSDKICVSIRTISRIENNRTNLGARKFSLLVDTLKVNPEDLLVPVKTHVKKQDKPKNSFDIIEQQLKQKLEEQANAGLLEKLHQRDSSDYQPLAMEIGFVKSGDESTRESIFIKHTQQRLDNHNRSWKDFDPHELFNPQGIYILSSDTGMGKTTFLRYLQLVIIEHKQFIPIMLHASQLGKLEFDDVKSFIHRLVTILAPDRSELRVKDFLTKNFKKVILLIDGLDQIEGAGRDYSNLLNKLLKIFNKNLVITSRPFAVVTQEENMNVKFLRLKRLSIKSQQRYFGSYYNRACSLCAPCGELIAVPMLAYMVRTLVENKRDKNVKNKAQLYKRFIDFILHDYQHDKIRSTEDIEEGVRQTLAEISYKSLAAKKPYIQKIPLSFCYKYVKSQHITIDRLLTHGLVGIIVDRSLGTDKFLFFSHQSFQEYLAAEWVQQHEHCVSNILNQIWSDKWRAVVLFLAGLIGEHFIRKIYTPMKSDDCIHSRLFLAAACCNEMAEISSIEQDLLEELKKLLYEPYELEAVTYLMALNIPEAIDFLIEQILNKQTKISNFKRCAILSIVLYALPILRRKLKERHIEVLVDLILMHLHDHFVGIASAVANLGGILRPEDIGRIIQYQCETGFKGPSKITAMRFDASRLLLPTHVDHIFSFIDSEFERIRDRAFEMLEELTRDSYCFVSEASKSWLQIIRCKYNDEDLNSFGIHDRILPKHIDVLIRRLKLGRYHDCKHAFSILRNLTGKGILSRENIDEIIELLRIPNENLRRVCYNAIGAFVADIEPHNMHRLRALLDEQDPKRSEAVLYAMSNLTSKLSKDDIRIVTSLLSSNSIPLKRAALRVLEKLDCRLNNNTIEVIINLLRTGDISLFRSALRMLCAIKDRMTSCQIKRVIDIVLKKKTTYLRIVLRTFSDNWLFVRDEYIPVSVNITMLLRTKIFNLLCSADETMQKIGLIFLPSMGNNLHNSYISQILTFLQSNIIQIRRLAITTLDRCKQLPPSVINAVIKCLAFDDELVRTVASNCLTKQLDYFTEDNLLSFLDALLDENTKFEDFTPDLVETGALEISDTYLYKIVDLLASPHKDVQEAAPRIIKHLAFRFTDREIYRIKEYGSNTNPSIRLESIRTLLYLDIPISSEQIDDAITWVSNKKSPLIYSAKNILKKVMPMLNQQQADRIIELYIKSPSNIPLSLVALSLPKKLLLKHLPSFLMLLDEHTNDLRSIGLSMLRRLADRLEPRHITRIAQMLRDDDSKSRSEAYELLRCIRHTVNLPNFILQ